MWPKEKKLLDEIRSVLYDGQPALYDVCERCVLRLTGIKDSREYEKTGSIKRDRDEDDDGETTKKRPKFVVCRLCIGILQEDVLTDVITGVVAAVDSCDYDADHYTVAVSLPVSLALRNRSLSVFVKERLQGEFIIPKYSRNVILGTYCSKDCKFFHNVILYQ